MRNNDEIVAYVDNLRKSQNMSLNELARATGLAKSSLSRYFNKTRDFPVNKVHLFAKALHTTSENILGFEPDDSKTGSTSRDENESQQADLDDDDTIFTFQGRPIPPEDLKIIRRLLKNDDDE
ncbi:helix-turn-helix domain-containing protein [Lactobacillus johnsonii]|uniref:DNA-binding helix-turn-helix protein n=1 Tax=Lactobacillus johnsonii ATCC 33200 TaxID=525330 RepID=C2E708_LACJH|nr:helix-turn-helix transcriptional regulator [Lactobacillus johnsonii]EEJ59376.1 DNA-binding helix-turn-helix protein [Lactobacillus johnsonii ATCC 33200]MCF0083771.1 helix-turn-helix transcriptional regulator [Lactobacillus johnsonii]MCT3323019.1 XRE family transcriptional regulator [Lactobacillus johnsonii]MCT3380414.1 XRE family transcriptional regulator [Lactobacillus johnsonii]MCT3383963.1 XRE family transcriptional regulator [Lactobacillus johnsonii]